MLVADGKRKHVSLSFPVARSTSQYSNGDWQTNCPLSTDAVFGIVSFRSREVRNFGSARRKKMNRQSMQFLSTIGAAMLLAGGASWNVAQADDLPPGVTIAATDAFTPPAGLGSFQAMTFVIDVAPGAGFPAHSHPGRSEVMVIQGDLTEHKADGASKVYHPGDAFIEEPGAVHSVTNAGSNPVRLVWTLLLPRSITPAMP
jgi:quercetin dioxygenase-like cupin family protein